MIVKDISFVEKLTDIESGTATYYFDCDAAFLNSLISDEEMEETEADGAMLSIEFPLHKEEASLASVEISTTLKGDPFDWRDISLPYEEIEALVHL